MHHRTATVLGEQSAAVLLNLPAAKKCISESISPHSFWEFAYGIIQLNKQMNIKQIEPLMLQHDSIQC